MIFKESSKPVSLIDSQLLALQICNIQILLIISKGFESTLSDQDRQSIKDIETVINTIIEQMEKSNPDLSG